MAGKGKGGNTVAAVTAIAEPIAQQLGLMLWDVRFVKEGANWYLRIFIDKEGGVGIDDCVAMSHALDKPLEDADPIDRSYCLEVSSRSPVSRGRISLTTTAAPIYASK